MHSDKQQRWRDHITAAKQFSGTIESYCRINGITPATFYYWRKKFSQATKHRINAPAISSFIPVEVVRGQSRSGYGLPDAKWLAEFIVHLSGGAM
jgi:transposase-like protein